MRCKDASSRQLVDIMKQQLAGDILKSLRSHLNDIPLMAEKALTWDKEMLIPESDWGKTREDVRASLGRFVGKVKETKN